MSLSKKFALVTSTALASVLVLSGCVSKASVDEDLSAGQTTVNWLTTGASIVLSVPNFDDDTNDCDWGSTSVNPVVVVNTYSQDMNFSITVNPTLARNLNFFPVSSDDGSGNDGCELSSEYAGTQYINVPAGSNGTIVGYIVAGGGQGGTNNEGGDNNVAIGAGGTQWYDFWLHVDTLNEGYQNLELNYSNTGGTDTSQNVQTGLFNGLDCSVDSSGSLTIASPAVLTTPYTSNNANAWTFQQNQPLCFGFLQPNSSTQG
ncbi:MAG: hypothetical protein RSB13_03855 [Aurantimicrobium sp.]|uniref:hypothetical protein n=1 Tax=Aurantimicrobium sp. TaxID=1930784 RepID=UPI002FCAAA61